MEYIWAALYLGISDVVKYIEHEICDMRVALYVSSHKTWICKRKNAPQVKLTLKTNI